MIKLNKLIFLFYVLNIHSGSIARPSYKIKKHQSKLFFSMSSWAAWKSLQVGLCILSFSVIPVLRWELPLGPSAVEAPCSGTELPQSLLSQVHGVCTWKRLLCRGGWTMRCLQHPGIACPCCQQLPLGSIWLYFSGAPGGTSEGLVLSRSNLPSLHRPDPDLETLLTHRTERLWVDTRR